MKYAFIFAHKKTWPVLMQCRVLAVNRNSYYHYQRRRALQQPDPACDDRLAAVQQIARASDLAMAAAA